MLGPFDYAVWFLGLALEVAVIGCAVARRSFIRYLVLNLYMSAAALISVGTFFLIRHYGYGSAHYRYFYFYSDGLSTILLFFVIIQFYHQVFGELQVSRYIRGGAFMLLGATALFSYLAIHGHRQQMTTTRFVVELSQDLYFVGLVLTYLLFAAVLKLRETRSRLVQLVLALGVYFSATAASLALLNIFPHLGSSGLRYAFPLIGLWLPGAWVYTFARVPEEARLATADLLAGART